MPQTSCGLFLCSRLSSPVLAVLFALLAVPYCVAQQPKVLAPNKPVASPSSFNSCEYSSVSNTDIKQPSLRFRCFPMVCSSAIQLTLRGTKYYKDDDLNLRGAL
jgi:hypothetical protein